MGRCSSVALDRRDEVAFDDVHGYVYSLTMKRRDLERDLRQLGWTLHRHGKKHDVWTDGEREEAIPRPTEIHERLAQAILRRARGKD